MLVLAKLIFARGGFVMTVSQVVYVLEVASCRNISQAAERLYISQSAVSQQIMKLERELGYSLFTRTLYGLELTEAGERFCEEARPAVDAWNGFCTKVLPDSEVARKQLRIGMGARVYSNRLFPEILSFFDSHHEIEVSFVTEGNSDFLSALRQKKIDLALDVLPTDDYLSSRSEFYSCGLIRERQCILMSEDDPRAALPALTFQDLHGSTMMSGLEQSTEARVLKEICRENGITLDRVYRSDGIQTIMDLVKAGRGIVLGPESFADYYNAVAVPLIPELTASLHFICLKNTIRRRMVWEFRDYLSKICKDR